MMQLLLFLFSGLFLLWLSAEGLIYHSTKIALKLNISKSTIALTIIACGASLPELFTNIVARLHNQPGSITLGSIIGSNCANIALVIGVCALIHPIPVAPYLRKKHLPILLFTSALFGLFLIPQKMGRIAGCILLLIGLMAMYFQLSRHAHAHLNELKQEGPIHLHVRHGAFHASLMLISLAGLLLGADLFIKGIVLLAKASGLPTRLISLTVVAIGTALPEWASAIVATARKQYEMTVALVIGSNLFNLFAIGGISALVRPFVVEHSFFTTDWPVMMLLTTLMWLFSLKKNYHRFAGLILLAIYGIFLATLFFTN